MGWDHRYRQIIRMHYSNSYRIMRQILLNDAHNKYLNIYAYLIVLCF